MLMPGCFVLDDEILSLRRNLLSRAISGIDFASLRPVSRTVVDATGRRVRIRLERGCWQIVAAVAADGGQSVDEICLKAMAAYPDWSGASAVRMYVLSLLRGGVAPDPPN